MRILICGDRNWENIEVIRFHMEKLQRLYGNYTLIHGAARGADTIAGKVGEELGLTVESYPANWSKYGKAAGPIRNKEMLDSGIDLVIAFHPRLEDSKGTRNMYKIAVNSGLSCLVVSC